jgi:hypothetical protein
MLQQHAPGTLSIQSVHQRAAQTAEAMPALDQKLLRTHLRAGSQDAMSRPIVVIINRQNVASVHWFSSMVVKQIFESSIARSVEKHQSEMLSLLGTMRYE